MKETYGVQIAKGSAYLITERIVTVLVRVVAFAYIARILTQVEMGVSVALTMTLGIAEVFSDLGFSSALAKYIAEYRGKNADYSPLLFSGALLKALTAGAIAVLSAVAAQPLSELLLRTSEYAILFQLLGIYLFFACFNLTMSGFLLGLNRIREMAVLDTVATFTRQVSAVALLINGYGLPGLITGWILGDLIYFILSFFLIGRVKLLRKHSTKENIANLMMLTKYSWPIFMVNIVVFVYNWFDQAVLLAYVPLSEVAIYSVADKAFTVFYIIPGALSTALLPYYSEQYGRNKHENVAATVHLATRYISLFFTPLALGLAVIANPVVTLFAGPFYASADTTLAIMSLFGGICGIGAALGVLLLAYNMTPTLLLINIASIGASLAATPLLLPYLGVTGMAIIRGIAMTTTLVLAIIALNKRISMRFDKEAIIKSWISVTVMVATVWLTERICFSAYLLLVYILVGVGAYVLSLRILKAVDQDDLKFVRNLLGKRAAPIADILEKILV